MWYVYSMDCYSVIKRNDNQSFVEMSMDLESVLQSKVNQKGRNKCHILMHICGIWRNDTVEPVCRAEIETQM